MFKLILILCIMMTLFNHGMAQDIFFQPPRITVPVMKKAPIIDGSIDPDEYRDAVGMYGFCQLKANLNLMSLFPAQAHFMVGCDGEKLYIAANCETGPNGILARAQPGRGGLSAFMDDSFEFVFAVDPEAQKSRIYHLIINNLGAFYSVARDGNASFAWTPKVEAKGTVKDQIWSFEFAMSLSELGISGLQPGEVLGLRVCRNWRNLATQYGRGIQSSWGQNRTEFFGKTAIPLLSIEPDAPAVKVDRLYLEQTPDVQMTIFNPAAREQTVKITYHLKPTNSQSIAHDETITLKPNENKILKLPMAQLNEGEKATTFLQISSADGQKIYYRRGFAWSLPDSSAIFQDKSADAQRLAFRYAYYPSANKIFLQADINALQDQQAVKKLAVRLFTRAGKELASITLPAPQKGISEFLWDIPDLKEMTTTTNPGGEYMIQLVADGIKNGKIERTFERKVFEWEGNELGKSDLIVPPFTPLQVNKRDVSVVLRKYTVNDLGLWAQIVADGHTLLKDSGMFLELQSQGKTYPVKAKLNFTETTPSRVVTAADWSAGTITGSGLSEYDYDGMMKYTLTINPGPETISSLRLVIPLADRETPLFHACADGLRIHYGGSTPAGSGKVWQSAQAPRADLATSYMPYLWLGREGSGLAVFGENDKGFTSAPNISTQELIREGDTLNLVYNIIAAPTVIKEPVKIIIGFQATPVKPMPENWRLHGVWSTPPAIKPYLKYYMDFLGSCYAWGGVTASADIYPRDEDISWWQELGKARKTRQYATEAMKQWVDGFPNKNKSKTYQAENNFGMHSMTQSVADSITFYTNARGVRLDTPESRTFLDEWLREEFQPTRLVSPAPGTGRDYSLDPTESYRDFAMTWYKKMLETGACDNLYWDDIFLSANFNRAGNDAYILPNGRRQPSTGLWNMRELVRRAAVTMYELKRTPRNMVHMTNTAIAPLLSFAQQNLDWEDNLGTNPFQERYTKEYIRTLSIGRQFGNLPGALGLVTNQGNKDDIEWCLRTGAGVMLTHEIKWTKGGAAKDYFNVLEKMFEFGYGNPEVKVWNYWETPSPITVNGDTSSIVLSKGNAACILVCNYAGDTDFEVKVDRKLLQWGNETISGINGENGKSLSIQNDTIRFSLKKYDFIFIKAHTN